MQFGLIAVRRSGSRASCVSSPPARELDHGDAQAGEDVLELRALRSEGQRHRDDRVRGLLAVRRNHIRRGQLGQLRRKPP